MDLGPVDVIVLEFPDTVPDPASLTALRDVESTGLIRIIDAVVVARDSGGTVTSSEVSDATSMEDLAADLVARKLFGMMSVDDADEVAELLDPGTSALMLLVENVWARDVAHTLRSSGSRLLGLVRIPPDSVDEAVEELSATSTSVPARSEGERNADHVVATT